IRSTRPRSRARSRPRRACRCRTAPRGPPRPRTTSGCRRRRWRRFSSEPLEVGEPDLDQRPDARLEAVLARDRERPLVALPDLLDRHALLQPVVARPEQVVDLRARLVLVHRRNRTAATLRAAMLAFFAVVHVLLSAALIGLVLMHSGRDTGLGGMGFTPASQGGTHIVERNLTRVTIVVALLFFGNTILLFRLLQ